MQTYSVYQVLQEESLIWLREHVFPPLKAEERKPALL